MQHRAERGPAARPRSGRLWPWAFLALALLAGCDEGGKPVAAVASHPWINPPREVDAKAVTLPAFLIYRVDPKVIDEAISELDKESYIQISPSMASHYAQQELSVPMEMRPFLVRALDTANAEIKVVQSMQGLWTRTIGDSGGQLRKQPLVVLIDPTPVEIFVTVEAPAATADEG